jgi:hypothetical protein
MKKLKFYYEELGQIYDVVSYDYVKHIVKIYEPKEKRNRIINLMKEDGNILQNTGLVDMNGKEIWEGDFVSVFFYEYPEIDMAKINSIEELILQGQNIENESPKFTYDIFEVEKDNEIFVLRSVDDEHIEIGLYDWTDDMSSCKNIEVIGRINDWSIFRENELDELDD